MSRHPGPVGRYRSRQSGRPSGPIGLLFGRLMPRDTASANDRAVDLLDLHVPSTVLELGYGQGRTVELLLAQGHRVLGADASGTMAAQASRRNRGAVADGRAQLVHGDGTALPFGDQTADAALTVHTVYFIADLAPVLGEVRRVLRPGGRLVVACRTADDPVPAWMDPDVYRVRPAGELLELLVAAGFDDVERHRERDAHATNWFTAAVRAGMLA